MTARRRAEAELRRLHDEYRAILMVFPDSIYRVDVSGSVRALGVSPLGGAGSVAARSWPAQALPTVCLDACRVARETGRAEQVEFRREERHLEARCVPSADGEVVVVVRDITERREAELTLRAREAELYLAQSLQAVGRLAGGLAHDFNNLLGVVLAVGEVLRDEVGRDGRPGELVDLVIAAAERAAELTRRLLLFARTERQQPEELVIDEFVQSMLPALAAMLPPGTRVEPRLAAGTRAVWLDSQQLHQLLINMVANARDGASGLEAVVVETRADADVVHIAVRTRISPSVAGAAPLPSRAAWSGVGAAIVQGLVERAGGWLRVEEGGSRGGWSSVSLPRRPVSTVPERESAPSSQERVLLFEPDRALCDALAAIVGAAGYHLEVARSPTELFQKLQREAPAVVVAAAESAPWVGELRERGLRLLWLTPVGWAPPGRGEAELHLEKPYTASDVLGAVRRVLEHSPRAASAPTRA